MRYKTTAAEEEFALIERDAEKRIEEIDKMLKDGIIDIDQYDMAIDAIIEEFKYYHNA